MKILMVTANFAPRGASPAIRTVNLLESLCSLGHEVRVVTYSEKDLFAFSPKDQGLSDKVPESVKVTRIPAGKIRRYALRRKVGVEGRSKTRKKLTSSPLASLMIPDPHAESIFKFVREASKEISKWKPDVVITHAYPFSMHVVGCCLKIKHPEIFWVADYGDPWSGGGVEELNRPKWRLWLDKKLENGLLKFADLVTLTTEATLGMYQNLFPAISSNTAVVTMGYDPNDFTDLPGVTILKTKTIVHAGRLYSEARDFLPFHNALKNIYESNKQILEGWNVVLVGEVEPAIHSEIKENPCGGIYKLIPWVTYRESLAWMANAEWLLLVGNKGMMQTPGKVYSYLGAGRSIIMTSESLDDPTAKLLNAIDGTVVIQNDTQSITEKLQIILNHQTLVKENENQSKQFTWKEIARRLCEEITIRIESENS